MKAALFNESFPPVIDGVSNVVLNYADILSRTPETEAVVATPRYPDTDYGKYPFSVVPYRSMAASELTGGYRTGNPFDMEALTQLVSFKPDILHAHSPATAVLMARIVRQAADAPLGPIPTHITSPGTEAPTAAPSSWRAAGRPTPSRATSPKTRLSAY